MTFKGSGELDGGQTFSVSTTLTDKAVYSTSNITLVTNSVGTFKLSSAEGSGGIGGFDDVSPTAWEEVWDSAIATNVNMQKGVGSSMNINWSSPSVYGTQLHLEEDQFEKGGLREAGKKKIPQLLEIKEKRD